MTTYTAIVDVETSAGSRHIVLEPAPLAALPITGEYKIRQVKGWRRRMIDLKVASHILFMALKNYRSVGKSISVVRSLYLFKKSILGRVETKLVKLNGKYYHSIYAPGYPSASFDHYIEGEFNRILPVRKKTNILTFIIFAITGKCPLQCEHCFEWNNLNKRESFSLEELQKVIARFQKEGIAQFHLSGGEPMVRVKDLIQVVKMAGRQSEFYALTSGFNFTSANARALKQAGLTGIVISLDHYDPSKHNTFRGFSSSFEEVIRAIRNAQEQQLMVAVSVCVTRSFIDWNNLIRYAELIKQLKVPFIQLLEPKAVGHYEGKTVFLNGTDLALLDKFYETLNFDPAYSEYPVVIYHGYYQRRVGCLSDGNRGLYIDVEGYVNACPFCSSKNFNIKEVIHLEGSFENSLRKLGCRLTVEQSQAL